LEEPETAPHTCPVRIRLRR